MGGGVLIGFRIQGRSGGLYNGCYVRLFISWFLPDFFSEGKGGKLTRFIFYFGFFFIGFNERVGRYFIRAFM